MKKRITALALACVMVVGTVAAAAGVEKNISVTPMDLTVNGQTVTPTKSDGTPAEVFAYEGATYAPVRYLSELLGLQVEWDKNDPNTAKLSTATNYTYADTIAWDGQYDVVVIGFGGAGATAAATAANEGASVLLLEKAPEGEEGGNTRVAGQLFAYGNEDEEATYEHYKALFGQHEIEDTMLRTYTNAIAHIYDFVSELTGIDKSGFYDWTGSAIASVSPEYPEFPHSDKISINTLHDAYFDGFLWKTLRGLVTDRADKIDVWFESPAVHLIQDPDTKTILGVQTQREGKTLNIRATNGVVMTCGGFENNPEMVANYLGLTSYNPIGGLYNTGDGITMALEVNADLWHMEAYEGLGFLGGSSIAVPQGERTMFSSDYNFAASASIMVAEDGNRLLDESEGTRHGHIQLGNVWVNIRRPLKSYVICTEAVYKAAEAKGTILSNAINIQHASSIAELAKLIDIDPDALTATVKRYNEYAKEGHDPEFGRTAESMKPIDGNSFYAVEVHANVLNTQGGAKRNEKAEVLDTAGNPIPHLYSAGEFGGITAFQYQGGGNLAECMIFGDIAGRNAAAQKEPLPAYQNRLKTVSPMTYTPGKVSDLGGNGPDVSLSTNEYLGVSHNAMGGDLHVKVTLDNGKITKVEVLDNKETPGIGTKAIEAIPDAIVKANSVEVDNVSTATITSKAIKEAVADALSQAK